MGFEYQISCRRVREAELKEWLLRHGGKVTRFQEKERVEFRFEHPVDDSQMSDITVALEEEGIYFCSHGGHREKTAAIFMGLVDEALSRAGSSDSITITSP